MSARGALQAALALSVAAGLHLAGFAAWSSSPGSAVSAGDGGADMISLVAASDDLDAMVADWDRPPALDLMPPAAAMPPPPPEAPPQMFAAETFAPKAPPLAMLAPPLPEAAPSMVALAPPEPSASMAPQTSPKPRARPVPPKAAEKVVPNTKTKTTAKTNTKTNTPEAPKPAAPAQGGKAAGSGKGAQAGDGGTAKAATLSRAQANSLMASWGASIRAAVERKKRHPSAAGRASGRVSLNLTVARNGMLQGVTVASSSGNPALDQAAVAAVKRAGRFAPAPKGLGDASYTFSLPISFSR